jgi:hypothetical protein
MNKPRYLAGIGSPLQNEPVGFDPMIHFKLEPKRKANDDSNTPHAGDTPHDNVE